VRQAFRKIVSDNRNRKMMLDEEKKEEDIVYNVSAIMQK